ncbi:DNA mismatch endonuclease Vsr [Brevundimonas sp.]|uniref:very short patch repair endonuclease n=1 Tax=Brevundimonas sp. TaxID=1871086 RepID=UPI0028A7D169|nr:DNA mismatch endonuclease Vsr [Brevundimonas sp.]
MDTLDPIRRSANMAKIRAKDTGPELRVRTVAHGMGLRFRLYRKDLPGKPDLVFPKHRLAIFVHGCFWHRHEGCRRATMPGTRREFWEAKFATTVQRDDRQTAALESSGWRVLILWECELKNDEALRAVLRTAIDTPHVT